MLSRHQKLTYYFPQLPSLPIISLLLLSLFLFRRAFDTYFFQDDFFFFSITKIKSLRDIFHFFVPRNDVQFYRPLTSEIYYLFSRWIFDLQPFGYHLIVFLFFGGTIILVYKIALRLFKSRSYAFLFTFFWATSPIHQDSLYWIANFSYIAVNFLFLLGFYIFLEKSEEGRKSWLIVLIYILGLLSSEFMIFFPVILFAYDLLIKKGNSYKQIRLFIVLGIISILYVLYRFLFPPDTHLYKFQSDASIFSSLRWFFLFFLGWAETVKYQMVRFYLFSDKFVSSFFWETLIMVSNLIVMLSIFVAIPIYIYFKEKKLIVWLRTVFKKLLFSLIWIGFNISPIIFISSQISPHRGSLAFFGFLLFLFFLTEKQLGILFKKYQIVIFLIILVWLTNSILVTRLNERIHWVRQRSDLSKEWINTVKRLFPQLEKGTKVILQTDDSEVKHALANGLALKVVYDDYLLDVTLSTTDTEEQTPHISTQSSLTKNATILIVNQIRGDEKCCTPGSMELIKALQEDKIISDLPYGWALRFDALENNDYTETIKKSTGELGLLLEVTPRLASASRVVYKGSASGSDWYFAKNAFLVGYTQEERKKLIDTLFVAFRQKFGFYPVFTVSWMIDAWSLSYIQKTYSVQLHELTKEQYETDSYTLDGGIFNAPYYPSTLHPLIPGYGKDKLNLVIVRQTISDILQNYGAAKARYTSQPNDYLESGEQLDISYFKNLVAEVTAQPADFQFAVLGFENSYPWEKYGPEYRKQLSYVSDLEKKNILTIKKPSEYAGEFQQNNSNNIPFYLVKNFSPKEKDGVLWFFGENYRARVIKKGDKLILDDLRNFIDIADPYKDTPSQIDYAYWIIPYLINGSQQYKLSSAQKDKLKKKELSSGRVLPDTETDPFGIILGEGNFQIADINPGIEIVFNSGKSIKFLPKEILIDQDLKPAFSSPYSYKIEDIIDQQKEVKFHFDKFFDLKAVASGKEIKLGYVADGLFVPLFNLAQTENVLHLFPLPLGTDLNLLSPLFQPDRSDLPMDKMKAVFYWNNKQAIAGRNPVRLFILPLNNLGRPTKVEKVEIRLTNTASTKIIYPRDYSYRVTPWFIDIWANTPLHTSVSLTVDKSEVLKGIPIEFVTDCQKNIKLCIYEPSQLLAYVKILINEQRIKFSNLFH